MTNVHPFLIVLCEWQGERAVMPVSYFEELFLQGGTGGVQDYFRTTGCNGIDLSGSAICGWYQSDISAAAYDAAPLPRHVLVQKAKDLARANGVNPDRFASVLSIFNRKTPHGEHGATAVGGDVSLLWHDNNTCEMGFIVHEMGHGLGLDHSFAVPNIAYGDSWDFMSWQTHQHQFDFTFKWTRGIATVGINAPNLIKLGALPKSRIWDPPTVDFSTDVTLEPLGQPGVGSIGHLAARINPTATRPTRGSGAVLMAEYRVPALWDQAIPGPAVILHEVRTDGLCYLIPGLDASLKAGARYMSEAPYVGLYVRSLTPKKAVVAIWDMPEGSLRREEGASQIYLVQNGAKCPISEAQLTTIHKRPDDVRTVPAGGLQPLPLGTTIHAPGVALTPFPVEANRAKTYTVSATLDGAPAAGDVLINGKVVAQTNTPFTHNFTRRRVLVDPGPPREWGYVVEVLSVQLPGLAPIRVDTGLRGDTD